MKKKNILMELIMNYAEFISLPTSILYNRGLGLGQVNALLLHPNESIIRYAFHQYKSEN